MRGSIKYQNNRNRTLQLSFLKLTKGRTLLAISLYLVSGVILIHGALVLLVLAGAFCKITDYDELVRIQNPIASEIYTTDGVLMGTYNIQNRQYFEPS